MELKRVLPADFVVLRGQTQKQVNHTILTELINRFPQDAPLEALDLPCGDMEFLNYIRALFPKANLLGADIAPPRSNDQQIPFVAMDLTRDFPLEPQQKFDLITAVSGVMMFSNTLSFIRNCTARLKPAGTIVVTNDNSATIIDRLAYLFLGRYRMFKTIYEDTEELTENVPVQELCRLLRTHGVSIEKIEYTSFYLKDLIYLPIALLVYPFQWLYLQKLNTNLPEQLTRQMYPFKHFFYKHYIITGRKDN